MRPILPLASMNDLTWPLPKPWFLLKVVYQQTYVSPWKYGSLAKAPNPQP